MHNNAHGESVLLVSSLSVLIVLLIVAAVSYSLRYTRMAEVRQALIFSHAY